ncbi:PKD domain-containing protein [Vicingaceae bacterium]|nr:PKD domain-containing protein [Vicingaceae bacterium]MDB4060841.1 PKD domain-containing protein [Vicingaceae bacterium]
MNNILLRLLIVFALFFSSQASATHIIGGFFSYECLGPVAGTNDAQYVIRAVLFKDSLNTGVGGAPGAVLENPLTVTLFNQLNIQLGTINIPRDSLVILVDSAAGLCVIGTPVVSIISKGYYSDTVLLRKDQAHKYVWRRCCRNNPDNILNPAASGSTFFIDVPEFDQVGCNTSPQLTAEQPFSFCAGVNINLDLSATDPDGDSMVYELCAPFDFPRSGNAVTQVPANPPPYPVVTFRAPATPTNPIPSNPAITIDPNTGLLTGIPVSTGKYLIGFCVKEYNSNGILLSTTIRDIQVKVDNCILQVTSSIQDQERFCDGLTIQFRNRTSSNVDSTTIPYKWDFGVTSLTNDTSRLREPTYTFPGPGFYNITLIANPKNPGCRDTSVTLFEVRPTLRTSIDVSDSNLCANNNTVDFSVRGIFQPSATFAWDFGSTASITTSTNQIVNSVQFIGSGSSPVQLIVSQDNCDDTTKRVITVVNNPTADFTVDDNSGCSPFQVNFTSSVNIDGMAIINYLWTFGDGKTSTLQNPTNTYLNDGSYDVTLQVTTFGDCNDVVTIMKSNFVQTGPQFSNNNTDFSATPIAGCYPLEVQFNNLSTFDGTTTYLWDFGDGSANSAATDPLHTYTANGHYDVALTMTTVGGCAETLTEKIDSAIYISLDSSKNRIGFTVNQDTECAPVELQFTDTSFFEGTANFKWYFGDGDSSELRNPLHTYQNNGIYDVQLILQTTEKCVDTLSLTKHAYIETDIKYSTNDVGFDFSPKEGCLPLTVQFLDSSKFLGTPQYFWDFGDGSNFNGLQNPNYTFTDTGTYSIGLLLITSEKCVDTLRASVSNAVKVLPNPIAQINYLDTSKSLKEALFEFTNTGSQSVRSSRYLINGKEVAQNDFLTYQFADTGRFQVAYIATNSFGCEDTSTAEIFVFDEFQFIVPNIFTPNGDNINDEFKVQACGVFDYEIKIFNRFGEKLFESNSLNINWDGRISGKLATSSVYFYTIKIRDFRNQILDYQGSITLLTD